MGFRTGQKVVYVGSRRGWQVPTMLQKGVVYTVQAKCTESHADDGAGIFLCEIATPGDEVYCDCFDPQCFRPAVDTDISVFTEMLTPSPTRTRETHNN